MLRRASGVRVSFPRVRASVHSTIRDLFVLDTIVGACAKGNFGRIHWVSGARVATPPRSVDVGGIGDSEEREGGKELDRHFWSRLARCGNWSWLSLAKLIQADFATNRRTISADHAETEIGHTHRQQLGTAVELALR